MVTRILHITPHMGGGVGRVLKHFTSASMRSGPYVHQIACLDYANDDALAWSRLTGIRVAGSVAQSRAWLHEQLAAADIVHVHWWNHPLCYEFLHRRDQPPIRAVLWAHANGYHPPHVVPDQLLDYADLFVLATPYSRHLPPIARRDDAWRSARLRTVFASPGFAHIEHVRPRQHEPFTVGYIGTVDYGKMHPEFLAMNSAAPLPDARFVVCGGGSDETLRKVARSMGVADRFDIRGHVTDVADVLAGLDVFGYPLQPKHYGASEVALLEAMAAGVVPVVLANGCEASIVRHGHTGIIAQTTQDYSRALCYLHRHPHVRRSLGEEARADAHRRFGIARTVHCWHSVYREVLSAPKRSRRLAFDQLDPHSELPPSELFVRALADSQEAVLFRAALAARESGTEMRRRLAALDPIFRGGSNGSVRQYARFFPEDGGLQRLCRMLDSAEAELIRAA